MKAQCPECDRIFDLTDETDANEWLYGHDCEASEWEEGGGFMVYK